MHSNYLMYLVSALLFILFEMFERNLYELNDHYTIKLKKEKDLNYTRFFFFLSLFIGNVNWIADYARHLL